jgi:hypothetical protein
VKRNHSTSTGPISIALVGGGEWRGKRGEARRGEARAALELGATRGGEAGGGERRPEMAGGGAVQQRSRGAEQGR